MYTIGLTGGIGSGKSTAAGFFASQGIEVINLDQIARDLVAPNSAALDNIAAKFGPQILTADGSLDRSRLAAQVFVSPEDKHWLEQLLHPQIRAEQQRRIAAAKSPYAVVEIPLLAENDLADSVDRVLLIDCPEDLQRSRAQARGAQSAQQIERTIAAQASRMERQAIADDIIDNSGTLAELETALQKLHAQYLQLAAERGS